MRKITPLLLCTCILILIHACHKSDKELDYLEHLEKPEYDESPSIVTRAVETPYFNWNTEFYPTPPGQNPIESPWRDNGSLWRDFDEDIMNDRFPEQGWELLYHTFIPENYTVLENPYFILYNKYRGTIRVFYYNTNITLYPSSNILAGISVTGSSNSSMLNFLGIDVFEATDESITNYQTMIPSLSTSHPLMPNTWYMVEYEIAYDERIQNLTNNEIRMTFNWGWNNISNISISGEQTGTISGYLGANSKSSSVNSALRNTGELAGTAGLSFVGMKAVNSENTKIPSYILNAIRDGAKKTLANAVPGAPGAIVKLASAIIGGGPKSISLNIATEINLEGTITEGGSLKSFSLMVPGTQQVSDTGQIPYYNKTLGLFNFTGKPVIKLGTERRTDVKGLRSDGWWLTYHEKVHLPVSFDYSDYLLINPELKGTAEVRILAQDIIIFKEYDNGFDEDMTDYMIVNPIEYERKMKSPSHGAWFAPLPIGVRFYIQVKPKNGDGSSYFYKTLSLEAQHSLFEISGPDEALTIYKNGFSISPYLPRGATWSTSDSNAIISGTGNSVQISFSSSGNKTIKVTHNQNVIATKKVKLTNRGVPPDEPQPTEPPEPDGPEEPKPDPEPDPGPEGPGEPIGFAASIIGPDSAMIGDIVRFSVTHNWPVLSTEWRVEGLMITDEIHYEGAITFECQWVSEGRISAFVYFVNDEAQPEVFTVHKKFKINIVN